MPEQLLGRRAARERPDRVAHEGHGLVLAKPCIQPGMVETGT